MPSRAASRATSSHWALLPLSRPSVATMIAAGRSLSSRWRISLSVSVSNVFSSLADSAFSIFLLRQCFLTIPSELRDAATIDGAGAMTFYWRVLMPLSKPAVTTVAVISLMNRWNDFMGPLVYLSSIPKFPVSLGLNFFKTFYGGGSGGGGVAHLELLMGAAVLVLTPLVVVFLVAQRAYIKGVITSGLRG